MTANERWSYHLRCGQCGRVGKMDEEQLDGWSFMRAMEGGRRFHWINVSEGFCTVEQTSEGYAKVVCVKCRVAPEQTERQT